MDMLRRPYSVNYAAMPPEKAADALADELGYQQIVEEHREALTNALTEQALKGDYSLLNLGDIQENESCEDLFWQRHSELRQAWNNGLRGVDLELLVAGLMGVTRGIITAMVIERLPSVLDRIETDSVEGKL